MLILLKRLLGATLPTCGLHSPHWACPSSLEPGAPFHLARPSGTLGRFVDAPPWMPRSKPCAEPPRPLGRSLRHSSSLVPSIASRFAFGRPTRPAAPELGHSRPPGKQSGLIPAFGFLSLGRHLPTLAFSRMGVTRGIRRLCHKQPCVLNHWRAFMRRLGGHLLPGPFSKLIQILGSIGWTTGATGSKQAIEPNHLPKVRTGLSRTPPIVLDHDGLEHDLLQMSDSALSALLEDGWAQSLACSLSRPSMSDAIGLDLSLCRLDYSRLTSLRNPGWL